MRRFIERDGFALPILPTAPGVAGISNNGQQPGFPISFPISIEESKGPQVSFLDHILRVLIVAGQPTGQIVRGMEMRQDDLLKQLQAALAFGSNSVRASGFAIAFKPDAQVP
jgi:hypothetical protein